MEQSEKIETYQNGELINTYVINYTSEELVEREVEKYKMRKLDGEKAFLEFAGEIRVKKLLGLITEEEFLNLEQVLFPVRTEITLGQWKSALINLEQIDPAHMDQDLFVKIQSRISDYILKNY
jgi:hypothetical protein